MKDKDKDQECSCETCGCENEDFSVDSLKEEEVTDENGFVNINFDISHETMLLICEAIMKKYNIDPASISVFTSGIKNLEDRLKESSPEDLKIIEDLRLDEYTFLLGKAFFNQFTLDALKDTIARGGFPEVSEEVQDKNDDNI